MAGLGPVRRGEEGLGAVRLDMVRHSQAGRGLVWSVEVRSGMAW